MLFSLTFYVLTYILTFCVYAYVYVCCVCVCVCTHICVNIWSAHMKIREKLEDTAVSEASENGTQVVKLVW